MLEALKELGKYLGKKLDEVVMAIRNTPQKLQVDMSESSKKLEEVKKKLEDLIRIETGKPTSEKLTEHLTSIKQAIQEIPKVEIPDNADKLKPQYKEDIKIHKLLEKLSTAVKDIKIPEAKEIDLSGLRTLADKIDVLIKATKQKTNEKVEKKLDTLATSLKNLKLEVPKTFKLDDMQLRSIRTSGLVTGGGGTAGWQEARNVTMANVAMATANTEYSYAFPTGTVSFHMKLRSQNAKFKYCWTSGASGTTYMTTPQNSLQSRPGVDFSGKTIYFQSATASQVMEIDSYQL